MKPVFPILIVALMLFAAILAVTPNAQAVVTTGTDNFDTEIGGTNPTADFYTFTQNNEANAVVTSPSHTASRGVKVYPTGCGGSCGAYFDTGDFPSFTPPDGLTVSFWFYIASDQVSPVKGGFRFTTSTADNAGQGVNFIWDAGTSTYTWRAQAMNGPGFTAYTGTTQTGITTGSWHELTAYGFGCGAGPGHTVIIDGIGSQATQKPGTCADTELDTGIYTLGNSHVVDGCSPCGVGTGTLYIDDFQVSAIAPLPTVADTSITVNNLVGFDVDPRNGVVIARIDDGDVIRTYNPATLATLASETDTDCTGFKDGVAAFTNTAGNVYTTYYTCNTAGETNALHIRNSLLTAPEQSFPCTDYCNTDIEDTVLFSGNEQWTKEQCRTNNFIPVFNDGDAFTPEHMRKLGRLSLATWDWANGENPDSVAPRHNTVAWTYYDSATGAVGVLAVTQNNENPDCWDIAESFFASDGGFGNPNGFCTVRDSVNDASNQDVVGITSSFSVAKSYKVQLEIVERSAVDFHIFYPDVTLALAGQSSAPITQSFGISCAQERWGVTSCAAAAYPASCRGQVDYGHGVTALVGSATDVYHVHLVPDANGHTAFSSPDWTAPFVGNANSLAISRDGHCAAYVTSTTNIDVVNATDGTVLGNLVIDPALAGNVVGMYLDDTGQTAWLGLANGASSEIYKWDTSTICKGPAPGDTIIYDGTETETVKGTIQTGEDGEPVVVNQPPPGTTPAEGTSCAGRYTGPVEIGSTYVPLGSFTNCASMAVETLLTVVLLMGIGAYLTRNNLNGNLILGLGFFGAVLSVFLWKFPWMIFVVAAVIMLGLFFILRPKGAAA